jgi:hypothetical protein
MAVDATGFVVVFHPAKTSHTVIDIIARTVAGAFCMAYQTGRIAPVFPFRTQAVGQFRPDQVETLVAECFEAIVTLHSLAKKKLKPM